MSAGGPQPSPDWLQLCLDKAFVEGRKEDVLRLLWQGATLSEKALSWTVCNHKDWMIEACFDSGLDVNQADSQGCTPLHQAILARKDIKYSAQQFANDHIIEKLIARGADPRLENGEGFNCFELAEGCGMHELAVRIEAMWLKEMIPSKTASDSPKNKQRL